MKDDELKEGHDIIQSFPTSLPTECTSFKRWHFVKTLVNVVINIKVQYKVIVKAAAIYLGNPPSLAWVITNNKP